LLVGHYGGYVAVGQYSIAEKFVSATRPFFRIMTDTFLPRVAYYAQRDPRAGIRLICISLSSCVVGAAISLSLFMLAPYIVTLIFGEAFAGAVPIVRLMSVIPMMINLNLCTSNLYMFNYGHERAWSSLLATSLLVFLAVAFVLLIFLPNAAIAVALALIAKEAVVLCVSAWFFVIFGLSGEKKPGVRTTDLVSTGVVFDWLRGTRSQSINSTPNVK
jgi:O-antigen/teichoic acid export membrane protein